MTDLKNILKEFDNDGYDINDILDTVMNEYDAIQNEKESKKINEEKKNAALDRAIVTLEDYLSYTPMDKDTKLLFINQLSKFLAGAGPSGKFEFSYGIKDNDKNKKNEKTTDTDTAKEGIWEDWVDAMLKALTTNKKENPFKL